MLRCLQRRETDPYFNLAAEEYFLRNAQVDKFMVWRNEPSVIIGKHQISAREVNHHQVDSQNIPVIRRITGGGTVYQDLGNVNFSFIRLNRRENPIDFKFFTHPIVTFLKHMGLNAEFEARSNIVVDGLKVSGNSAHVFRGRVLHHGTLLFNTDLEILEKVISGREQLYNDNSVRSQRRKVSNIASHIKAEMTNEDFMDSLFSFMINYYDDAANDVLNDAEYQAIQQLADIKYRNSGWNFGYSPDYQFTDTWKTDEGEFMLCLTTREAVIESIRVSGPSKYLSLLKNIEEKLPGVMHEKKSVATHLKNLTFTEEKPVQILNQIIDHLF